MPQITPKSPDLLFAQAAAYATERPASKQRYKTIETREAIFELLGKVSVHNMDFTVVDNDPLYDEHSNKYVSYLRKIGGSRSEIVQRRLRLSMAFEAFRPQFEEILEAHRGGSYRTRATFLGEGQSSKVYKIESAVKTYAVRISRMIVETDSRVSADLAGGGIPNIEELTAISYADRATIAEIIPGRSTAALSEEQIRNITEQQLQGLLDIVILSFNQGVALDPSTNNFLHDPELGFGIVDYHSQTSPMSIMRKKSVSEAIRLSAIVIGSIGNRQYGSGLPDFYADESKLEASKDVLFMYRNVVEQSSISEGEKNIALAEIDECIGEYSPERLAARQAHYEHYYGPRK